MWNNVSGWYLRVHPTVYRPWIHQNPPGRRLGPLFRYRPTLARRMTAALASPLAAGACRSLQSQQTCWPIINQHDPKVNIDIYKAQIQVQLDPVQFPIDPNQITISIDYFMINGGYWNGQIHFTCPIWERLHRYRWNCLPPPPGPNHHHRCNYKPNQWVPARTTKWAKTLEKKNQPTLAGCWPCWWFHCRSRRNRRFFAPFWPAGDTLGHRPN